MNNLLGRVMLPALNCCETCHKSEAKLLRSTSATDQNGRTTYYTYDDADRLIAVTDPANNTTQYAYDTEDHLVSITDANGHSTQFAYNARGWVTQTSGGTSWTHDPMGRILSERRTIGSVQGEYVNEAYNLDGSAQSVTPLGYTVTYTYNGAGRPITAKDYADPVQLCNQRDLCATR
jgi:YD repeat-containing protein